LIAFQIEALYTVSPKGENSSSEVRRLSLGVHSAAIRYSTAEKILAAFSRLESMPTKLYVGNLPFNTTENELQELFSQAGPVQEVMLMQDKFTGKSRGFAFVTMGSDADAQKAIAEINGKTLEGRALTVNEARPREPRPPGGGGGGYGGGRRDGGQRRGR
jgi:RNA recognition motif-containing protein